MPDWQPRVLLGMVEARSVKQQQRKQARPVVINAVEAQDLSRRFERGADDSAGAPWRMVKHRKTRILPNELVPVVPSQAQASDNPEHRERYPEQQPHLLLPTKLYCVQWDRSRPDVDNLHEK